ncbi:MAG: nucleotidyltransferase family protein [Acidobacteriaceae bacterium]
MFRSTALPSSPPSLVVLSRLLFPPREGDPSASTAAGTGLTDINRDDFEDLLTLANSNHVVVRALDVALKILREAQDEMRAEWATTALAAERARVNTAIPFLRAICAAFEEEGHDVTVIKSLDHWPDLGSDLDLYTSANSGKIAELMARRFQAQIASRSWGDRLAGKWNFMVPGLPEAVEIHMGRLGQTGEQIALASRLAGRARSVRIEDSVFRVPAASDRLMISTLQRMYRHFYFRLCDIVDTTGLADAGDIDFEDLRSSALACGIWEGVATYLAIVSDYVQLYRGVGLVLPHFVTESARFGGDQVYFARGFIRVPILPQSAGLYGTQLTGLLRNRELHSSARLGLLPWLATAAAVGQKITGSDKGIW